MCSKRHALLQLRYGKCVLSRTGTCRTQVSTRINPPVRSGVWRRGSAHLPFTASSCAHSLSTCSFAECVTPKTSRSVFYLSSHMFHTRMSFSLDYCRRDWVFMQCQSPYSQYLQAVIYINPIALFVLFCIHKLTDSSIWLVLLWLTRKRFMPCIPSQGNG